MEEAHAQQVLQELRDQQAHLHQKSREHQDHWQRLAQRAQGSYQKIQAYETQRANMYGMPREGSPTLD